MLPTAVDRAEALRHIAAAEAQGQGNHPMVKMLRRIISPPGKLQVTLPYPISANVYWRTRVMPAHSGKPAMAITYPSKEAKAYKDSVGFLLRAAGVRQCHQGRIGVHLQLWPNRPQDWATRARKDPLWADTVQRLDLDNCRKVINDSLNGVLVLDDKQIWLDAGEVMEPDGRDKCVVLTIWPIQHQGTQLQLDAPQPAELTAPPPPPKPMTIESLSNDSLPF